LNSGVNDRRRRGFFRSILSMMGILSGAAPLMVDVRQTGGSPTFVAEDLRNLGEIKLYLHVVPFSCTSYLCNHTTLLSR